MPWWATKNACQVPSVSMEGKQRMFARCSTGLVTSLVIPTAADAIGLVHPSRGIIPRSSISISLLRFARALPSHISLPLAVA